MSIEAMKQAVDAITNVLAGGDFDNPYADLKEAATALQHAIDMSERHVHISDKDRHDQPESEPITVEFREYLTRLNWQQGFERGWDDAVEKLTLTQEKLGYTALPKREWVGLDHEMMRNTPIEFNRGALWAERWLKEKNNG